MPRSKILVPFLLTLPLVLGIGGYLGVRHLTTDTSCGSTGRDAAPAVEAWARKLPATHDFSWRDGCADGAVLALRFSHAGTPTSFATAATRAGCSATGASTYTCPLAEGDFSLRATAGPTPGQVSALAVFTGMRK